MYPDPLARLVAVTLEAFWSNTWHHICCRAEVPEEGHVDVSGKARSAPKTRFPHRTREVFILSLRKKKEQHPTWTAVHVCVWDFFLGKCLSVWCPRVNARNIRLHCNSKERRIYERGIDYCCRGLNSTFPRFTYALIWWKTTSLSHNGHTLKRGPESWAIWGLKEELEQMHQQDGPCEEDGRGNSWRLEMVTVVDEMSHREEK